MNCEHPIRIKNQYNGKWMYVPCRHCDSCRITSANKKAVELEKYMTNFRLVVFVTLTYSNDYVPYVIPGVSYIMRGSDYEIIDDLEESLPSDFISLGLQNHSIKNAIGVLYYRDVQLFFKRFRKYINKNYGRKSFKYFALGEYGTKYARPHYHLAIMSNELSFAEIESACVENWSYHNWSRFVVDGINQAIKICDKSTAYYLASYFNCGANDLPISQISDFRTKTWRSKGLDYGTCESELEIFRESVRKLYLGNDYEMCDGIAKPFVFIDATRKDNVSTCVISKRYLSAAFSTPKGFSQMSFGDFVSRAKSLVECFSRAEEDGISKSVVHPYLLNHNKSADMAFYRSFKRHKYILGFELHIMDYLDLFWRVNNYYASILLERQMLQYEELTNKDEYWLEQIDTHVENLNRKYARLIVRMQSPQYKGKNFKYLNLECPPASQRLLSERRTKFKKRLLKKHLNDMYQIIKF